MQKLNEVSLGLSFVWLLVNVQSIFELIQVFPILDSLKLSIGLPNCTLNFIRVKTDSVQFFLFLKTILPYGST